MKELIKDFMFTEYNASLYLNEGEEVFSFEYYDKHNFFKTISIKRPIINIGNIELDDIYYDIETPYGYGGYIWEGDEKFIKKALKEYASFCKENRIIAEFIRFHPFIDVKKIEHFLDFLILDRYIVIKNINNKSIIETYKSKVRNIIRKSMKYVKVRESFDIDKFMDLYYFTMNKNKANDFYYFPKNYFEKLLLRNDARLLEAVNEKGNIISMSFFIFSTCGYYHLSANSQEGYQKNANYLLLHYAFEIAQKLNIENFILGGGTTNMLDDNLLKFKKKFSENLKPFYIGGKIFNQKQYNKYIKLWNKNSTYDIKYFLKYRLPIVKD